MKLWTSVEQISSKAPEKIALRLGAQALTYQELCERSAALAQVLQEHEVGPGSVVGCYVGNNPAFVATLLAAGKTGACFVPLDPSYKEEELLKILSNFGGRHHLVTTAGLLQLQGTSVLEVAPRGAILSDRLQGQQTVPELASIGMIQFSSGSTGEPKGILLTHDAVYDRALGLTVSLGLTAADRTLCAVPLSHSHGIDCLTLPTLLAGGTLFITAPELAAPTSILGTIEREKITFFSSVPSFYELCLKLIKKQSYDLSSLRLPFCGSAALSEATAESFFERFGVSIKQGYGLAEIGVICLNLQPDPRDLAYGSVGKPIQGMGFRIEQEELVVTSRALYSGYLIGRDYSFTPQDQELFTGDLVQVDGKGRFYLTGRKKDFVNVGGSKVFPLEVEALIKEHQQIRDCVVGAEPAAITGQEVVAYLELLSPGADFEAIVRDLRESLRTRLSDYKVPKRFYLVEQFARSPLGKILRSKVRKEDVISTSDR